MNSRPTILLVDDEPHSLTAMRMALEDDFDCLTAQGADAAAELMAEHDVQVVFCDQRMPGRSGVEFLSEMRERWPDTIRIIITGYTETNDMIAAINDAAIYQFVTKPWHPDMLLMTARNAADLFRLNREHGRMSLEMRFLTRSVDRRLEDQRKALREGLGFENILRATNSPMNAVVAEARLIASFDVPCLLTGPGGIGKAALARAMHYGSLRSDRPFHEVNCPGQPDDLLAAELFGNRRGGAGGNRLGLLQKADRGTVFLNGVNDLSPEMQVALMRFAVTGAFRPLGATEELRSDARLICGAHGDLGELVEAGHFRSDLYQAISATQIAVPPLSARRGDIALLAQNALFDAAGRHSKPVHGLTDEAVDFLTAYDWPGNLRELENEMLRMLIHAQEPMLGAELISRHILQSPAPGTTDRGEAAVLATQGTLKDRIEEIEARVLRETLTRLKWNKSRAAAELGLSRVGLRAKIDRYAIPEPARIVGQDEQED